MHEPLSDVIEARFGERVPVPGALESDATLLGAAAHRSHRRYRDESIPDAVLRTLLACAFSAPSKSDLQQACAVRVTEPARREALEALVPSMPWVAQAAELLVFCGDSRRIRRICELRGKPFVNDHLDAFFNAAVDTGIVLATFVRAAAAAGLGCCPLSVIRNQSTRVAEILELPQYVFPVAGLAVGHPAGPGHLSPRLSLEASVHTDRYDDADLEALLDEYDQRRTRVHAIPPEKQREVDRFGRASEYGWSEDKARQVSVRERGDFGAFVRDQGFDLS